MGFNMSASPLSYFLILHLIKGQTILDSNEFLFEIIQEMYIFVLPDRARTWSWRVQVI